MTKRLCALSTTQPGVMCFVDSSCIKQTIEIDELTVVRKYPPDAELANYPQNKLNRNIEAYDRNDNLVWIIEEAPDGGENLDKAYMRIWLENGRLIAGNWIGVDYFVALDKGTVTPVKTNIRPW